jgi:hypothetical protein
MSLPRGSGRRSSGGAEREYGFTRVPVFGTAVPRYTSGVERCEGWADDGDGAAWPEPVDDARGTARRSAVDRLSDPVTAAFPSRERVTPVRDGVGIGETARGSRAGAG